MHATHQAVGSANPAPPAKRAPRLFLSVEVKSVESRYKVMPKVRRSVSLNKELMDWINEQIERKRFKDVSHGLEYAVYRLMEEHRKEKREYTIMATIQIKDRTFPI